MHVMDFFLHANDIRRISPWCFCPRNSTRNSTAVWQVYISPVVPGHPKWQGPWPSVQRASGQAWRRFWNQSVKASTESFLRNKKTKILWVFIVSLFFHVFLCNKTFHAEHKRLSWQALTFPCPSGCSSNFSEGWLAQELSVVCFHVLSVLLQLARWQECGNVSDPSILRTPAFNLQGLVDDFHALTPNNWDRCIQHVQHILS